MPWIVHTSRDARNVDFALSCLLLADPDVGMLAESELDTDPGSSSYELKAITETHSVADSRDPWENDEEAIPFNGSGDARVDPARSSLSTAAAPWETPAPSLAVWDAAGAEPWYSRVLQLWGIVFLIWAAMIVARSLFLQFVPGSGPTSRSDAVSSVVSVLLLVPGAAALFLLVDLGRYIRGLRPPTSREASAPSTSAKPVSLNLCRADPGAALSRPHPQSVRKHGQGVSLCWFVTAPSGRVPCKGQTTKHGVGPHTMWGGTRPICPGGFEPSTFGSGV